jgi:hypothetical protein
MLLPPAKVRTIVAFALTSLCAFCGGNPPPPPPPPVITVGVSPSSSSVEIGGTVQFTATVANTTNTAVTWQVNGITGGNNSLGTISASGLFTAPSAIPNPASVTITAVSAEDATKMGTASLTITAAITITVTPSMPSVEVLHTVQFIANVTNASSTTVTWEVNGIVGGDSNVGMISNSGLYTAPNIVPSPATVTVTAALVADDTKKGNAVVTITPGAPPVTVKISPTMVNVQTSSTQQFTATVTNASDKSVTWEVNQLPGGNALVGTISDSGLYTAPDSVPSPDTVMVIALSNADPSKSDTANVTIKPTPVVTVTVSPSAKTLIVNQSQQFTATVSGSADQNVTWGISGASCSGASCGTISSTGNYVAPSVVPTPTAAVIVRATSAADNTKSGTATVTITPEPEMTISVSPDGATIRASHYGSGNTVTFTATVSNAPSPPTVTWQLGCISSDDGDNDQCGDNDSDGGHDGPGTISNTSGLTTLYTAPDFVFFGAIIPNDCGSGNLPTSSVVPLTVTATASGQTKNTMVCINVMP